MSSEVLKERLLVLFRTLLIECEQAPQYLLIENIGKPTISSEDCVIETLMRILKPSGPSVVQVGERALLKFRLRSCLGV